MEMMSIDIKIDLKSSESILADKGMSFEWHSSAE